MGFKLPGKSITSGTSGHSSALKMRESENAASALKQTGWMSKLNERAKAATTPKPKKAYVKKGGKATGSMKDYGLNTQARRDEYDARGWAHDDTTKIAATAEPNKIEKTVAKGDVKKTKIADKAAKKTGEVTENVTKKVAKLTRKGAKKVYDKGSKEHLVAKKAHLVAKEADRQGKSGGRKQGLFRKLSSKINKKRQEKTQAKIDAQKAEENA
tara:strand:+ start:1497 stop:2135 length:639 start_codon:yes stop_codon:yes gene_type:complete